MDQSKKRKYEKQAGCYSQYLETFILDLVPGVSFLSLEQPGAGIKILSYPVSNNSGSAESGRKYGYPGSKDL